MEKCGWNTDIPFISYKTSASGLSPWARYRNASISKVGILPNAFSKKVILAAGSRISRAFPGGNQGTPYRFFPCLCR